MEMGAAFAQYCLYQCKISKRVDGEYELTVPARGWAFQPFAMHRKLAGRESHRGQTVGVAIEKKSAQPVKAAHGIALKLHLCEHQAAGSRSDRSSAAAERQRLLRTDKPHHP